MTTGIMGPWDLGEPFFIPANQVKVFHGEYPVWNDVSLINIVPCHLIGVDWEVFATSPNAADTIPLISIPNWDFNWQGFFTFPTLTHPGRPHDRSDRHLRQHGGQPTQSQQSLPNVVYGDNTEDEMFFVFSTTFRIKKETSSSP